MRIEVGLQTFRDLSRPSFQQTSIKPLHFLSKHLEYVLVCQNPALSEWRFS
jgi:hypothetical protein